MDGSPSWFQAPTSFAFPSTFYKFSVLGIRECPRTVRGIFFFSSSSSSVLLLTAVESRKIDLSHMP